MFVKNEFSVYVFDAFPPDRAAKNKINTHLIRIMIGNP